MTLQEVQDFLAKNKDQEDVQKFVAGFNPLTLDRVQNFVRKDRDAVAWLDSEKDKHTQKALKTWQDNNLDKYYQDRYKKEHPGADPKDSKISELEKQVAEIRAEAAKKDLTAKALKYAGEKKLPSELVSFFIGKDEDATKNNLNALESAFTKSVNSVAEERLKAGYKPPKADEDPATDKDKAQQEINSIFDLK